MSFKQISEHHSFLLHIKGGEQSPFKVLDQMQYNMRHSEYTNGIGVTTTYKTSSVIVLRSVLYAWRNHEVDMIIIMLPKRNIYVQLIIELLLVRMKGRQ